MSQQHVGHSVHSTTSRVGETISSTHSEHDTKRNDITPVRKADQDGNTDIGAQSSDRLIANGGDTHAESPPTRVERQVNAQSLSVVEGTRVQPPSQERVAQREIRQSGIHIATGINDKRDREWQTFQIEADVEYMGPPRETQNQGPQLVSPQEFQRVISDKWPWPVQSSYDLYPEFMYTYYLVRQSGLPNYLVVRHPLKSQLNIMAWRRLLSNYHDQVICEYLEFGWPISYTSDRIPTSTMVNHQSAEEYPRQIEAFLEKEHRLGAMLGPFQEPPFSPWTQISPLMTRPKKDPGARRIILDLSFPTGASVNSGIQKNTFEGELVQYTLPAISDLADMVKDMGPGGYIWKADLERAYRQLRVDPLAVPLLGMAHKGRIFVDICPAFGCRTSGVSQQRVSQAIVHLMNAKGHACLAYVDDFCGLERTELEAKQAFINFHSICADLGLAIAHEKSEGPATRIEWLGFAIDTKDMTVQIPQQKLNEVIKETQTWETRRAVTRRELQILAGRLAHVTACIKHSRKFMSRILFQLRNTPTGVRRPVTTETRKDISWFLRCAQALNCKRLIIPELPQISIECDACPSGGGGFMGGLYYDLSFPDVWTNRHHIARLEAINIVIAVKTLAPRGIGPHEIVIRTDNSASAHVLVSGKTQDIFLAACARELAYIAIMEQWEITVNHVPGESLILADALSRRHKDPKMNCKAIELVSRHEMSRVEVCEIHSLLDTEI